MRFLDLNGKVWSALVGLVVIAAITLLGLMMVPQQSRKFGIKGASICEAADKAPCACPKGYNYYDASHPQGCTPFGYSGCENKSKCWQHIKYLGEPWYSAPCGGYAEGEPGH